jgi:tetratricopeptide (TPR) repeat protein
MEQEKPSKPVGTAVWRQWNQALAQKLAAGGHDLAGQAQTLTEALDAARRRGDRHSLWAALNALTKISLGLQQVKAARELSAEALVLAEELFGPQTGEAGTVLSDVIFIEALEGREPQALVLARRLKAIIMSQATDELDQAFSYNLTSLATFHAMRGDDDQVEGMLWEVIRRGEESLGQDDEPDLVLFVYRNLGDFYRAQGRTDKAEHAKQSALALMERAGYRPQGPASGGSGSNHSLH